MSCYMRHMEWMFEALDLENEKPVRKQLDNAIREVMKAPAEWHCPEVWAQIKSLSEDGRAELIAGVAQVLDRR
jgi:hypothetical protein